MSSSSEKSGPPPATPPAATELNAASDGIGPAIVVLDAALKKLNLGISTWVTFARSGGLIGDVVMHQIGYAKIGDRWGITIMTSNDGLLLGHETVVNEWLFANAPRALRLEAIERLPDLLEQQINEARDPSSAGDSPRRYRSRSRRSPTAHERLPRD